jgi:hypothetical protein
VVDLRATGLNVNLETEGVPFIGPLDTGGSAPLDLILTPTRKGPVQLTVHLAYRDDLNQVQTWNQSLTFKVNANSLPAAQPDTPERKQSDPRGFWTTLAQTLKAFVGLGS